MKLQRDGAEALAISRANKNRAWMFGPAGTTAKDRFNVPGPVDIQHKPRFALDSSLPIFTMGSCFAREIENVAMQKGLTVLTKGHGVEGQYFDSWDEKTQTGAGVGRHELGRGALNKYTVHSMGHEIRTALLGETYPENGLIQLNETLWYDPHSAGLRNNDHDTVLMNRQRIAASTAEIKKAGVVFFTLGLTETWIYKPTGMPMNVHPGVDWLARMKDRLAWVDYGFQDALEELSATINLIREKCNPDMRFIVTVSPVPFGATFKETDVIVANSGSKATLRAVADELTRRFDFVDYFPSYELVAYSPREISYAEDHLHVRTSMVRFIMDKFIQAYYPNQNSVAA